VNSVARQPPRSIRVVLDEALREACIAGLLSTDLLQVSHEREARKRCWAAPDIVLWVPAHAQRNVGPGVDVLEGRRDRDSKDGGIARIRLAVAEVIHQADGCAIDRRPVLRGVVRGRGKDGRQGADVLEAEDSACLDSRLAGRGNGEASMVLIGVREKALG